MELKTEVKTFGGNYHYIPIPIKFGGELKENIGRRFVCTVNEKHKFHGAILSSKTAGPFIMVGREKMKALEIEKGEKITLLFEKDESKYQMETSEEFVAVIETDEEGQLLFDELTPGKQRNLIHYINTAKQSQKRIDRALTILDNLKLGIRDPRELCKPSNS